MDISTGFTDAAMQYLRFGYMVLPIKRGQKVPCNANGSRGASSDWRDVVKWSEEYGDDINIGIVAGPSSGHGGLFVVDIDAHEAGHTTWQQLCFQNTMPGGLPPMASTPSGGVHIYFKHVEGCRNTQGVLGPGIDTKSTNGYVVAPPSVWDGDPNRADRPGGAYTWAHGHRSQLAMARLIEPPRWLVGLLERKLERPVGSAPVNDDLPPVEAWRDALHNVANFERAQWVSVGMALKSAYGDAAYDVWEHWSGDGYSEFDARECVRIWRSFRGAGKSVGSLFYLAREAGFDFSKWEGVNA